MLKTVTIMPILRVVVFFFNFFKRPKNSTVEPNLDDQSLHFCETSNENLAFSIRESARYFTGHPELTSGKRTLEDKRVYPVAKGAKFRMRFIQNTLKMGFYLLKSRDLFFCFGFYFISDYFCPKTTVTLRSINVTGE